MRPVFLRIEPTLESSFFSAVTGFGCGLVAVFVAAFFDGTAAAAGLISLVFGSSTRGSSTGG